MRPLLPFLLAMTLLPQPLQAQTQETNVGQEKNCQRLRSPVLGFAIEHCPKQNLYQLVDITSADDKKGLAKVVTTGSLEQCERVLLATLTKRHGRGGINLAVPTFGGKQFWADVFVFSAWRIQEHVYTGHFRLLDAHNTRRAYGSYEACRSVFEDFRITKKIRPSSSHLVLLVHGLFRAKESFAPMEEALNKAGFDAQSINYPSTRRNVAEHAQQIEKILENLGEYTQVSFVTHSLGGIVVRELLSRPGAWKKNLKLGRVVMLGPPNQGSMIIEALDDWFPLRSVAGASAMQLTRGDISKLAAPPCEFAIIAGGKGNKRGYNPLLKADNDGVVRVDNTRLSGARDFLLVDEAHTFLMANAKSIDATISFLQSGHFEKPAPQQKPPSPRL